MLWADETFADSGVLLHLPQGFDARRPAVMVVYFHGHGANLGDDVARRQQLPAQVSASGANAVLVAPQLAVNAADSSPGKLWQPGGFARLLDEAAQHLAKLHGDPRTVRTFAEMPVVIVAYSGGYVAAAWSLHHGGADGRVAGVVLLDAVYGEIDKFADWLTLDRKSFLVSAYTVSTRRGNERLIARSWPSTTSTMRPRWRSASSPARSPSCRPPAAPPTAISSPTPGPSRPSPICSRACPAYRRR